MIHSEFTRALTGSREAPELTFTRVYDTDVQDLREACTSPQRLSRWFGKVSGDPAAVGDSFRAELSDDADDVAVGRVLACDEHLLQVAWSWQGERESTITVSFEALGDSRTQLVLTHRLTEPGHAPGYGGGWEQILRELNYALNDEVGSAEAGADIEAVAAQRWRSIIATDLVVEQQVAAPIERVWAALASSEGLKSWWWRHWSDTTVAADVRVGGRYQIVAPSQQIVLSGRYLVVDEPHRLAFTWLWRDADGESSDEAVDIRLVPEGGGTRVSVRHTGPWTDNQAVDNYRQGWQFTLGELADSLSAG